MPPLGHFHPLLVHLPIGGLIVLAALELLAKASRYKKAAQNRTLILGLTVASAAISAGSGWLLASSGHYDPELLRWHKFAGTAVALGSAAALLLNLSNRFRAYGCMLCATVAAVALAGHLGGSMTYGRGFLTRRSTTLVQENAPTVPVGHFGGAQDEFFSAFVQPVLQEHCSSCHGPEKQEADLRLDSYAGLQRGGLSGPAIVPGRARESLLVQRLLVPNSDDNHMPPDGKASLSPLETSLVQWWIEKGLLQQQQAYRSNTAPAGWLQASQETVPGASAR